MACLVHKYGGSSLATPERIDAVATKVRDCLATGHQVAVVVSAMAGETNRLLALATALGAPGASTEMDVLLGTGEQASAALLCLALRRLGIAAESFSGAKQPVQSTGDAGWAQILKVRDAPLRAALERGVVPVVAGFQGLAADGALQTLGRGGSDTSAVAVALALNADECRIYTDVDGVCSADPTLVPTASCRERMDYEEMLEMASSGAQVLQYRAVALAGRRDLKLRVLSSLALGGEQHDAVGGTLVASREYHASASVASPASASVASPTMEQPGSDSQPYQVVHNRDEAQVAVSGVPDQPGIAADILGAVASHNILVDLIVQNTGHDRRSDLSFTVPRSAVAQAASLARQVVEQIGVGSVQTDDSIAKVALVGYGLRCQAGVAGRMFAALAEHKINIRMIATSEVRIAVIVQENALEAAVRALHTTFCE